MKNKIKSSLFLIVTVIFAISSCTQSELSTIDLSGEWSFKLDSNNVGIQELWYTQSFDEVVVLPGTTDENKKGKKNDKIELNTLTRKYLYLGKAWYRREVDIPNDWQDKRIQLF